MKNDVTFQKNIENKVLSYCRKHKMFRNGDRVVLGVSGGADSVCLLFVLLKLRECLGIDLCVVHVNHGVREDAGEDAAYVEKLCNDRGIPFRLKEIRLEKLAKELEATMEEAGRMARYQAFEEACRVWSGSRIAVAHNSNDRAETMLFHLFRGTGLKGMTGILPVRGNIVRPLLCLERSEIEEYLKESGILYKHDSTNDTDDYTRNRIRHHILPYAKEYVTEGCINNMCRAADIFEEEESYLEEQTLTAYEACVIEAEGAGTEVGVEEFLKVHPVIRKRLLLMLLKRLSPRQQDIAAVHIEDMLKLFTESGNREIHLPYGIRGRRRYEKVKLESLWQEAQKDPVGCDILLPEFKNVGDKHIVTLPDGSQMTFSVMERPANLLENQVFFENGYTKWFDCDKIMERLRVRTRQTGDYLTIRGKESLQHKKLKEYMVTEKIPKEDRDTILLLAEEKHVLWLVGYRISEYYKITRNTKRILEVRLKKRKEQICQNV